MRRFDAQRLSTPDACPAASRPMLSAKMPGTALRHLLQVLEVFEAEIGTIEAGDALLPSRESAGRDDGRQSSAARCESRRARRPVETTSTQQHAICAMTRPARRRRIAFDGPVLSRCSTAAGLSCRSSKSGMRPQAIVMPTHTADTAAVLTRSGAKTRRSASCAKKSAGTMSVVHRASKHPERTADHGDENAVREQAASELAATGAERDANRGLVRAGGRAGQQEGRDVGARDEEDGASRGAQQPADARHAARRFRRHAGVGKHGHGIGAASGRVHGGLRLIGGHAGAQAAKRPEGAAARDRPRGATARAPASRCRRHGRSTGLRASPARPGPRECRRRRCESAGPATSGLAANSICQTR